MDWAGPSVLPQKRHAKITAHYITYVILRGLGQALGPSAKATTATAKRQCERLVLRSMGGAPWLLSVWVPVSKNEEAEAASARLWLRRPGWRWAAAWVLLLAEARPLGRGLGGAEDAAWTDLYQRPRFRW